MRRFSSYGPIDKDLNYYAPRKLLIDKAHISMVGENPQKGGHYITVWAPRQSGKTWVMQQILFLLQKDPRFHVLKINLEVLKDKEDIRDIINIIARKIGEGLGKKISGIYDQDQFQEIFKKDTLDKPLILILDEFDALAEKGINAIVSAFRNIHISRQEEMDLPTGQKTYLLHAVALIGVRSVLGVENKKGSPFNIQRSLHISNLTFEEVQGMFQWYQKDSGQEIEPAVIEILYQETKGQPGFTCWLGEILTEGYENHPNDTSKPIRLVDFQKLYRLALDVLPNNNMINLISKAKVLPYKHTLINLFKTEKPLNFNFDDEEINYLYMNGIIEPEIISSESSIVKFASPFVQKRLFNYFSRSIFKEMGQLVESFFTAPEFIFPDYIDIPVVLALYQTYLDKN
ncbi:MAG TPA: ATP-binding protein, partial [Candidatus Kapabacteria bacterium]|nr:ATP-binding protein [Candidatus Kapabacteria bacterium]